MTIIDPEALSQVLGAIDLRVGVARREQLDAQDLLPLVPGEATLVYVADGAVRGIPPLDSGCRLDIDRESHRVEVDGPHGAAELRAGDAFLTLGRGQLALAADETTTLIVVALELAQPTPALNAALPDYITVTGFDVLEPAAAALAENMGPAPTGHGTRQGDPLICRLMATTVLLSVIRSWAENGCAPEGWPHVRKDPFLDRVVEAIHQEPGREWTVERLAGVGAMSRSAFAERFRSAIGRSPADYVTEVRIDAAKRMLEAGRSVSETSRELGYASDEGFSRAFRRRTGMNPSAWRRLPVPA
ncbi:MAG: helix-turn-helix transcriptional regulator [Microbacterium sp.]|uniref:helix-turn-helix transcriptional regulator n=1 Tax=Microbacterium sp. TaxID=51671 RepID=UPI001DCA1535|nr:AraC family transcriptional regulator [Microbacterium sp.]MBW8761365.1 helix-turn-helix transcriptional regulator [Microbacterium sp.]